MLEIKQDKFAALLLNLVFSGLALAITTLLAKSWGFNLNNLEWWQFIVLGNITTILSGVGVVFTERITVKVIEN